MRSDPGFTRPVFGSTAGMPMKGSLLVRSWYRSTPHDLGGDQPRPMRQGDGSMGNSQPHAHPTYHKSHSQP